MPQAEISFNYLGQIDQILQGSKLFRPGRERIGAISAAENPRQHVLAVSGIVVQGKLQMDWNYSGKLHRRETIAALAERYLDCLRQLIAHCLTPDAGGFTPSDFPLAKLTQKELDQWIPKDDGIEDVYALSAAQQGMLFHSLLDSGAQMYFVQLSCHIAQLNVEAFQRAWNEVIQRHGILRTGFLWDSLEEPVQFVRRLVKQPWQEIDASDLAQAEQEMKWRQFLVEDRQRGFDLRQPPLLRLALMRTTENGYYFCWSSHHILLDGWCRETLIREVFTLYEAYQQGTTTQLKKAPPYRDYIAWLQKQDEKAAETFWRKELKGITTATRLGIERQSVPKDRWQETAEVTLPAGRELTEKLENLARKQQLTLNTLVQGAWGLLLSYYSGERDVIFGMPVSGRSAAIPGIEEIAGPFINTLPVLVHVAWEEMLDRYLQLLQKRQAEVRDFEHSSLLKVQGWSEIPHGTPLFENILVFENYPVDTALQEKMGVGMNISAYAGFMSNHYPLTLTVAPRGELSFMATYDGGLFEPGSVERMQFHLRTLLENMVSAPKQRLADISLLTEAERYQMLREWNQTDVEYPSFWVHELFAVQAAKTPQKVAVECGGKKETFAELNRRSNQLARFLKTLGVGPEVRVGICLERGVEMVVGLLGILKAGGAYVPLDPDYPQARLHFMITDAQVSVLLTQKKFNDLWNGPAQKVCLEDKRAEIEAKSGTDLVVKLHPQNLAYVIYTSGSTGKPKGVGIVHQGVSVLMHWARDVFGSDVLSGVFASTSICFDLSVFEIFLPLSWGGKVIVAKNALQLPQFKEMDEIALVNTVPSAMLELVRMEGVPASVKIVNLAGEALHPSLVKKIYEIANVESVINLYGPSEDTTYSTYVKIDRNANGGVTIGRPIAKTQAYVLDTEMRAVPVGVKGELWLGGEGLARGYLGRPELTADRFLPNPFSRREGERLYGTGDQVRWTLEGNLEFLGRIDHQIKLRGYRIELGEIEAALQSHDQIRQAVVLAREDAAGSKRLVAYLVGHSETRSPNSADLRKYLGKRLPDYMVPSAFVFLNEIPLTSNGKVDRKALLESEEVGAQIDFSPSDEVELELATIWESLLNVSHVGRRQTFFELGGHSLLAIRLIKRIQEKFGRELPLSAVFEAATIEQMSGLLRGDDRPRYRSNLVPIQSQGSNRPLFFVHPGGGGVGSYRDLARLLGEGQPFFGLQALDDEENKQEAILSIEQRAARYIEVIQTVDPDGPYILGGWSMGGFIAYEMAQQLKQQNREIAGLLLVDIIAKTESKLPSCGDEAEELLEVTREMGTTEFSLDSVKGSGAEERLQYLLNQLIEAKVLAPEVSVTLVRSFLKGLRRRNQSLIDYKLSPYSGPVTLIRAEKGTAMRHQDTYSGDLTTGFSELCSKVQVAFVPGTHDDLMFSPHVESLAEAIRRSLQEFDLCKTEAGQQGFAAV
jgi:amino acid adenylation domain-containing protein/non-ribosomal peptide synthase protein (TIGR01720 family)